jgi:hypothetical protein
MRTASFLFSKTRSVHAPSRGDAAISSELRSAGLLVPSAVRLRWVGRGQIREVLSARSQANVGLSGGIAGNEHDAMRHNHGLYQTSHVSV